MLPKIVHESWKPIFEKSQSSLLAAKKQLVGKRLAPLPSETFKAFRMPISKVRAVMVGLAPYNHYSEKYQKLYATGLAFGTPMSDMDTPSLQMIRDCVAYDCSNPAVERTFDNTLESWEEQGVLLLNTSLTVEFGGNPRRHIHIWFDLVKSALEPFLGEVPIALLGEDAKKLVTQVTPKVIRTCHPAATARRRYDSNLEKRLDFRKSELFKQIDTFIEEKIEWDKIIKNGNK